MTLNIDQDAFRERFLSGRELYGDDFTPSEVTAWFEDEREASARLWATYRREYVYEYHALNVRHGYRHLPDRLFEVAVGLGAAYGHELLPIIGRIGKVIVVEPSAELRSSSLRGVPLEYRNPAPNGDLPCESESADLVTCHGVLHHIPNVTHVVRELARCLKTGGYALVREPVVSMGEWTNFRPGLTTRERGIPIGILRKVMRDAGLRIARESFCLFPGVARLGEAFVATPYNYEAVVALDSLLCRLTTWNLQYHAARSWKKVRPTSAYIVTVKE